MLRTKSTADFCTSADICGFFKVCRHNRIDNGLKNDYRVVIATEFVSAFITWALGLGLRWI